MHVKATPYPEQVIVIKTSGGECSGSFCELLKKDEGIVGIASVAGTGEFHIGISRLTSTDAVRRKLVDAAVPATVAGTFSPAEYRKAYGHYFKTGAYVSCEGGCGK